MKNFYQLEDWKFKDKVPDKERTITLKIGIDHPPIKKLLSLTPAKRREEINSHKLNFGNKLLKRFNFDSYKWDKTNNRLCGLEVKTTMENFKKLTKVKQIHYISILSIEGAIKIKRKPKPKLEFYCIKMTVAIQIENAKKGMQRWEERFVLIKAHSFDDAYEKVEKYSKNYGQPYLNSDARLVRWKIESLDDCYETSIEDVKEFNNKEGVEVYSRLRDRKMTKERYWNGKIK